MGLNLIMVYFRVLPYYNLHFKHLRNISLHKQSHSEGEKKKPDGVYF